jgi:hypothetical protein
MGSFVTGTIRIPIQALAVGNRWKYEQFREEEGVKKSAPDLDNWVWFYYWYTFAPEACEKRSGLCIIHWFELGTLALLCLNLWFVSSVLNGLRETNYWLAFLTRVRWDEIHGPDNLSEGRPNPPQ